MKRIFLLLLAVTTTFSCQLLSAQPRLDGPAIEKALAGNTAIYDNGAKQYFSEQGWTDYFEVGRPRDRGKWEIRGNQYCSWWERGGWACYDVTGQNDRINFIAPNAGTTYPGKLLPGKQIN